MHASLDLIGRPCEVVPESAHQPLLHTWLAQTRSLSQEHSLRVLVVLSLQPLETGSGVYVQEVVRELQALGHRPYVLAAHYRPLRAADIPSLSDDQIYTIMFADRENAGQADVAFPIPGMSPDMPYLHVDFQALSMEQLDDYCHAWITKIRAIVREIQPHIVHVNHLWLLPAIARVAAPWLPIVATSHGTDYKLLLEAPAFGPLVRPGVQCLDAVLSISDDTAHLVKTEFGISPDRIHIIGNGYNQRLFNILPQRFVDTFSLERDLGLHVSDLAAWDRLVLSVGRFADFKGFPYLIQAAKVYSERYNALTLIVGEGTRRTRRQLEQAVEDAGLAHRVLLPGKIAHEDVGLLMNHADVFVLPSIDEPFGLVLLEALACGVPSVAANRGGPPFFVPAQLREQGLVSLIRPVHLLDAQHPDPKDEVRYIQNLARAISLQLAAKRSRQERQLIAQAVSDQTWAAKVKQITAIYLSAIHMRRQVLMNDV